MTIHYKLIDYERVGDAPFIGALICAVNCRFNCKNCQNSSLKKFPTKSDNTENIVNSIAKDPFNKGIILGGLEWTLQMSEAVELAKLARKQKLLTMLYTGNSYATMRETYSESLQYFDYIKCGLYLEDYRSANHEEYGVILPTSNQHIYKKGVDYCVSKLCS